MKHNWQDDEGLRVLLLSMTRVFSNIIYSQSCTRETSQPLLYEKINQVYDLLEEEGFVHVAIPFTPHASSAVRRNNVEVSCTANDLFIQARVAIPISIDLSPEHRYTRNRDRLRIAVVGPDEGLFTAISSPFTLDSYVQRILTEVRVAEQLYEPLRGSGVDALSRSTNRIRVNRPAVPRTPFYRQL